MPAYKNVTNQRQTLNGKVIESGQSVFTTAYYDENDTKLLKIDDAPYFNPVILSEVIEENEIVKIPEKDNLGNKVTKYAIHFYLEKGEVEIFYNSLHNVPSLKLYSGAKWNLRCFERNIDQIIVNSINQNFILWIIIERLV